MTDLSEFVDSDSALEDLFKTLGNELRIEILWTLAEADGPVSFTTLQERLGVEDSGNFNYHLNRLTNHFVTSSDHGYELRSNGRAIVQTIREGTIGNDPDISPRLIDLPCPFCGADQKFSYGGETLQLQCSNCSGATDNPYDTGTIMSYEFPPSGLLGRSEREVAAAAHRLYDAEVTAMTGGVCPRCAGTVEGELDLCEEHDTVDGELCRTCRTRFRSWAVYTCSHCGHARQFPPWFEALYLPEVIAFFYDTAGLTRRLPFPKFLSDDGINLQVLTEEIRATGLAEVAITMGIEDARCTVVVDERLEITVEDTSAR